MATFYLAARVEAHRIVGELVKMLKEKGHECIHDWTKELKKDGNSTRERRLMKNLDLYGVEFADNFIMLIPDHRRGGAHIELGNAMAKSKHILLLSESGFNWYKDGSVFYQDLQVVRVPYVGDWETLGWDEMNRLTDDIGIWLEGGSNKLSNTGGGVSLCQNGSSAEISKNESQENGEVCKSHEGQKKPEFDKSGEGG